MATEADTLERWFIIADANHDGRIEGTEAISFFQKSGLPRETLKEIWGRTAGTQPFMSKQQFYGAIRLVSLAQLSGGSFTAVQAQQMLSGTAPPPPLPKMTGLTPGTWTPDATSPTFQPTGGSLQPPSMQYTGGSLPGGPPVQVPGQVPYQYTGGRPEPSFPPLPLEEMSRYGQLFHSMDSDQDGFVHGGQCIELFSSRGVDRNSLKQIWQVVAGNAGQITKDQFIKCLYLIETTKQGIPVPSALPLGAFPPIAQTSTGTIGPQGYGQGSVPTLPAKAVFQPNEPAAYPGWRGPAANESLISTLDPTQRDRLMAERLEAQKKDQQMYIMNQEAETARSKKEFYEKALQELTLFKSRMDVASMEVQEKLKREQENAAEAEKRYDQIRLGAEEAAKEAGSYAAALQDAQNRKLELENKLNEMQQDLAARERAQPEMVQQMETQIQMLQEAVAAVELRRNTLTAELESYKHQQDLLHRRQGDLQMACAAAEAEVHSASGDIEKIMAQVDAVKESNDAEQIQRLLREAARVYSNLHSHACKAGVEIPAEARLTLYGNDVSWSDDLIGAGVDITAWQDDGFVLVDAFPDVREDMDMEFERAIQEAVKNIRLNETTKVPLGQGIETSPVGGFGADPFQTTVATTAASEFTPFDAFPSVTAQQVPAAPAPTFAVSFDDTSGQVPPIGKTDSSAFAAVQDSVVPPKTESSQTEGFESSVPAFGTAFQAGQDSTPVSAPPAQESNWSGDPFGDSAFA